MIIYKILINAGVLELVDGADSKSVVLSGVWVRVPPPAPNQLKNKKYVHKNKTLLILYKKMKGVFLWIMN